ncbi:cell division control protein 48 homolog C-like [Rutidosis leptorrhynchoides]|uniref:cell division control protein 48 homolog C-like n=1 Tax=Rutidosis leptorrhynchoides TaxID=125765 RepID=UPI003A9A380A
MSIDELAKLAVRVRDKYTDYRRIQIQPFTNMVRKNLGSLQNNIVIHKNGKHITNSHSDDHDSTPDDSTSDDSKSELEENSCVVSKMGEDDTNSPKTVIEEPKNVEVEVVTDSSNKTSAKTKKRKLNDDGDEQGKVMFKDLGGIDDLLQELKFEVIVSLRQPTLDQYFPVDPVSGILLHGPPGCGKTCLARAIANEADVPFHMVSATELVSGISGASEESIRELFAEAYRSAPSIVFIDETDAIASKRENQHREMEKRIVTQLMTCMDESHKPDDKYVLVIGATNRPDTIDPALRRSGRFDREYLLGLPNENAREKILSVLTRKLKVKGALDLVKLSRATAGFVGADLKDLVNTACRVAKRRFVNWKKSEFFKENNTDTDGKNWLRKKWTTEEFEKFELSITMSDFEVALKQVQPSLKREGFSSIPNVKWEDVGGYGELKEEFNRHIVRRVKYPNAFKGHNRVKRQTGFLLYGPPGCGKSLIAKAVANEVGASFIHIKGSELLNKYVGESEKAIQKLFNRARTCAPCILFLDEVEGLTTKRGNEGGWVVQRTLNQLLIELDGGDENKGVYVIGATNRPDEMDPAVLRSGRLGKRLYVPLPTPDERGLILKALSTKMQLNTDVDLIALGKSDACHNFSGADLLNLINEADTIAADEEFRKFELTNSAANEGIPMMSSSESSLCDMPLVIKRHFEQALECISPTVSDEEIQIYNCLQKEFSPKHRT